jgi:hypothetical protein
MTCRIDSSEVDPIASSRLLSSLRYWAEDDLRPPLARPDVFFRRPSITSAKI